MPASHLSYWRSYFKYYPDGDTKAHRLLATLCSLVAGLFAGKDSTPPAPLDFAWWLDTPEGQQERLAQAERAAAHRREVEAFQLKQKAGQSAAYFKQKRDEAKRKQEEAQQAQTKLDL